MPSTWQSLIQKTQAHCAWRFHACSRVASKTEFCSTQRSKHHRNALGVRPRKAAVCRNRRVGRFDLDSPVILRDIAAHNSGMRNRPWFIWKRFDHRSNASSAAISLRLSPSTGVVVSFNISSRTTIVRPSCRGRFQLIPIMVLSRPFKSEPAKR
jgi:hypothetical protein